MQVVPPKKGNSSKRTLPRQVRTRSSAMPRWISPVWVGNRSGPRAMDSSAEFHQGRFRMPEDEPALAPLLPIDRRAPKRIPALSIQIDSDPVHLHHGFKV